MKKSVFDLTTSEWAAAASAAGQAAAQNAAQRGRSVRGVKDVSIDNAAHDTVLPAEINDPVGQLLLHRHTNP